MRFKVIDVKKEKCAFLIDTDNKFASIPLNFMLADLNDEEKDRLNEWIDFLNEVK